MMRVIHQAALSVLVIGGVVRSEDAITTAVQSTITLTTTIKVHPSTASTTGTPLPYFILPPPISTIITDAFTDVGPPPSSPSTTQTNSGSQTTPASQSTSKPPESATTHTISVGAINHKFTPDTITAAIGDTVEFKFSQGEHWIIRGDYDFPCVPYEWVGRNRLGFSSGLQKVDAVTDDGPKFSVRINDTSPVFYYCGAPDSCVKHRMMGVINPSSDLTLDGYLRNAKSIQYQLTPNDPWPAGDDPSSGMGIGNKSRHPEKPSSVSINAGQIAGIVIGSVAILALIAGVFFVYGRRKVECPNHNSTTHSDASPRDVESGLEPPKTKTWEKGKKDSISGQSQSPVAEMPASKGPAPKRPVNNSPYFYHPITTHVSGELDGSPISHYTLPPLSFALRSARNDPDQIGPVELPTSNDPGNSPLPDYDECTSRQRVFSWAAPETSYRPDKKF